MMPPTVSEIARIAIGILKYIFLLLIYKKTGFSIRFFDVFLPLNKKESSGYGANHLVGAAGTFLACTKM